MVILGIIESRRVEDLGRDGTHAVPRQFLLEQCLRGIGLLLLIGGEGIDARTVLRSDIVALTHPLGRVMTFPEHL